MDYTEGAFYDFSTLSNQVNNLIQNPPKNLISVVNNNPNIEKTKRYRKPRIPKSSINLTPTVEQKMRLFDKYTKPILNEYDIEDPNQKLVENLKNAFNTDVELEPSSLPSFGYSNEIINKAVENNQKQMIEKIRNDKKIERQIKIDRGLTILNEIQKRKEASQVINKNISIKLAKRKGDKVRKEMEDIAFFTSLGPDMVNLNTEYRGNKFSHIQYSDSPASKANKLKTNEKYNSPLKSKSVEDTKKRRGRPVGSTKDVMAEKRVSKRLEDIASVQKDKMYKPKINTKLNFTPKKK